MQEEKPLTQIIMAKSIKANTFICVHGLPPPKVRLEKLSLDMGKIWILGFYSSGLWGIQRGNLTDE